MTPTSRMPRVVPFLAWCLLAISCAAPRGPDALDVARRIDEVFADMDSQDTPGATVAVITDGQLVYSRGYGSAQLEHRIPNTPQTVFHVASVSKQFTAMGVTLLADDGALSLDDPPQKHLRYVPELESPVTLHQMIHHTSGIRDQWELLAIAGWRLDDVITTDHVVGLMSRQRELNFEPNSEYMYSNMGYTLLGETVRAVSGMSLSDFTNERIFEPLGMTRTHFHDDHEHIVNGRAYSYAPVEGGGFKKSILSYANAGATSLFTTADDLVRWLDNFRHEEVGGPAVMAKMKTRGVLSSGDTIEYAHGLSTGTYRGLKTIGHGGADAGFRTQVTWFPEANTGIVVLSNVANGNPAGRAQEVADIVLADLLDAEEPEADPIPTSAEALESAPGRFLLSLGPVVSIEESRGRLQLHLPQTAPSTLVATGDRSFKVEDLGLILVFEANWDSVTANGLDGTTLGSGTRLEPYAPDPRELADMEGTFYSPELEALYRIESEGDELTANHLRHGQIVLTPLFADEFASDQWFLSKIRFERDAAGSVNGLRVSGGRVQNLRFVKLTTPLPN